MQLMQLAALVLALVILSGCQDATMSNTLECQAQLRQLEALDQATLTQREFDGPSNESSQGALMRSYHASDDSLKILTVSFFGEMSRRELTYHVLDRDNFQLTTRDIHYQAPISSGEPVAVSSFETSTQQVCSGVLVDDDTARLARKADHQPFVDRLGEFLSVVDQ